MGRCANTCWEEVLEQVNTSGEEVLVQVGEQGVNRGMASAAVCCMAAVWEKLLYAVFYSSQIRMRGQLYGRHTAAYSSFFCCIAVWFAVSCME